MVELIYSKQTGALVMTHLYFTGEYQFQKLLCRLLKLAGVVQHQEALSAKVQV